MPITYTNRKGQTYVLCRGMTKSGKPRYFFAREPQGRAVDAVLDGYHIEESVNGVVSLVKDRPQVIKPEELAAVEAALKRRHASDQYRAQVKGNQIVVYERQGPDIEGLMAVLEPLAPPSPMVEEFLSRSARYIPIMRFVLRKSQTRTFDAERWHFSGSIDDWIYTGRSGRLGSLARTLIPLLGTDRFFDLYRGGRRRA